ncbi:MAG: DUF3327 domain-containing protein [Corynebacterium sp.]|nr:DUF3327 domain-containing protein [Corynebacterium sp.]
MPTSWSALIHADFFNAAELLAAWNELDANRHEAAQAEFWHALSSRELPLRHSTTHHLTFLYRDVAARHVHLTLNRITDKHFTDRGLLTQLPGSDIWVATFDLGAAYVSSYGFQTYEVPPQPRQSPVGHEIYPWVRDPYNPNTLIHADNTHGLSVVAGPYSGCIAALSAFDARTGYTPTVHEFSHHIGDEDIKITLASVSTHPEILLICPDGEKWHDRLDFAATLAAYQAQHPDFPSAAVATLHNADGPARMRLLQGDSALRATADQLFPAITEVFERYFGSQPYKTVFAGQSLGGLSALLLYLHYDPALSLDLIIAQSPSLWWRPGGGRPHHSGLQSTWLARQCAALENTSTTQSSLDHPELALHVGLREDMLLEQTLRLHTQMRYQGLPVHIETFDGGHDMAWWMAGIIHELATFV